MYWKKEIIAPRTNDPIEKWANEMNTHFSKEAQMIKQVHVKIQHSICINSISKVRTEESFFILIQVIYQIIIVNTTFNGESYT